MIEIGIGPNIIDAGSFVLSWHGLLSVVAVILAVYLVGRWAPAKGISSEVVYSAAVWAIIAGILGARIVHVIDEWGYYMDNPSQIIAIWNGGIAVWGAVIGGFVGGWIYATLNKIARGPLADVCAPAMLIAMAVGRIGDIINGEHIAMPTNMPWGIVWSHPTSPTFQKYGLLSTHPAVIYELILDLVIFAVIWWYLRKRLQPDGMVFAAYFAMYSFGRFFILFFHDYKIWLVGLNEAQIICLVVLAITVPLLAYKAKLVNPLQVERQANMDREAASNRPTRKD